MSLTKFDLFFNESTYKTLMDYIENLKKDKNTNFTTSTTFWDDYLIGNSTPIIIYQFTDTDRQMFNLLKKEIEDKIPYYVTDLKIYFWPKQSYITWHNDGLYKGALTVYLNEKWDENWGGYFMYEDEGEIKAIKPKKNLGVYLNGGTKHCVTTVHSISDMRVSLQCFLNKEKKVL